MDQNVSLLEYLQPAVPFIPIHQQLLSAPATNNTIKLPEIGSLSAWTDFSLSTILQVYRPPLIAATVVASDMFPPNPQPVNSKAALVSRISEYISPLIRCALRCGFAKLATMPHPEKGTLTTISLDSGDKARRIGPSNPDLAYVTVNNIMGNKLNRAPGVVELSRTWHTGLSEGNEHQKTEYLRVLRELSRYMAQHHAQYGFILTNQELVVVRRNGGNDSRGLELSKPIMWYVGGDAENPKLTVLLALWYLGMLVSRE
ncbi:hypothetical protein BDW59DRAFT_173383 [Aspergillus cavernicola]|uniref:Uncharacterized protein n=1 Tax=Aspergillus cavernicola TaxID=176166 RepID=A0ABR4I734_9EURO